LTLFGYDLRFRAEESGVGEVIGGKPAELIRTALARAYFCEELARPLGLSRNSSELF
jgi:c-di-GMP-related signal transduction protein